MLRLDPCDAQKLAFALLKAVRMSCLALSEIADRLKDKYVIELTQSGLSHSINRGTIRLQRALQILAVRGVREVQIKGVEKRAVSD